MVISFEKEDVFSVEKGRHSGCVGWYQFPFLGSFVFLASLSVLAFMDCRNR